MGLGLHKKDRFAVAYGLFKTGKVVIGFLDSNQFTLLRAKVEQHDSEGSSAFEPADRTKESLNKWAWEGVGPFLSHSAPCMSPTSEEALIK